jgi:hypothetical protein
MLFANVSIGLVLFSTRCRIIETRQRKPAPAIAVR